MRTEFLNGGNIGAAIDSLMAASLLCNELQNKLHGDAVVHPRDYIGGNESEDYATDVAEWRKMLESIREVEANCQRRAMELDALRATHRQRLALTTMIADCQSAQAKPRSSKAKP